MKNKIILIISIVLICGLLVFGYFKLRDYFSNNMFDEGSLIAPSRKSQLIETKQNLGKLTEDEKNEFVNNCLKTEMISQEEADFLLGITNSL